MLCAYVGVCKLLQALSCCVLWIFDTSWRLEDNASREVFRGGLVEDSILVRYDVA